MKQSNPRPKMRIVGGYVFDILIGAISRIDLC